MNVTAPRGFAEEAVRANRSAAAAAPVAGTTHFLTVGAKGRVLLTAGLRAAMGLKEGDRLVCDLLDGVLTVQSQPRAIRQVQLEMRALVPEGVSVVDEFIADKRREAALEWDEEALGPLPEILAPCK